ncbi:histidine kinase [Streptomyces sp. NPDC093982]|uniref:sensor histidine kinase n=1 Tax=Streptomyces sp. NPDC093982 TaxID=3155077 RepID=UPI00343FE010
MALYTLAAQRPFRVVAAVGVPAVLSTPVYAALHPVPHQDLIAISLFTWAPPIVAAIGWGMFVRSRHQLVLSLRERAQRAEVEAGLRAERARRLAREEIAREMHDVLAHRLSLLSVHAGALEFRSDAPPKEIGNVAGVIKESAHQALQDLREVIGVLRAPEGDSSDDGRLQPGIDELPRLIEEARTAGTSVTLVDRVAVQHAAVPERVGRTAYRIVQEGLTNARKHAPRVKTVVTVMKGPETGLTIEVRNPLPTEHGQTAIPGSGLGLIGLAERAALTGGRLEHGLTSSGDFRLYAWLPWPGADVDAQAA